MRALVLGLSMWTMMTGTVGAQAPQLSEGHWVFPHQGRTGAHAPTAYYGGGYEQAAYEACAYYGCDGNYLIAIMNCESGQDPNAWHPNPYGGTDIGIMQINDATHGSIAYADPISQIWWSAEQIAEGKAGMWSCA
jgi:soluble lytic murein transglycosylase-like protein